jgi:hypothetical protein
MTTIGITLTDTADIKGQFIAPNISDVEGGITLALSVFRPVPGIGIILTDIKVWGKNQKAAENNLVELLQKASQSRNEGTCTINKGLNERNPTCKVKIKESAHCAGGGSLRARGRD